MAGAGRRRRDVAKSPRFPPLWSPKPKKNGYFPAGKREPEEFGADWAGQILARDCAKPPPRRLNEAERLRRLVQGAMERQGLSGRLAELLHEPGTHQAAMDFGQSCLMSLALWHRFGSAEYAERMGWLERTDYAAMVATLPTRAVEAAISLWRSGQHAAGVDTTQQRSVRQIELRAWAMGNARQEAEEELRAAEDAAKISSSTSHLEVLRACRAQRAQSAGEVLVRKAYERLTVGPSNSLWDLWRKREAILSTALEGAGFGPLREALRTVRGYCGPDMDHENAAWTLTVDLLTITPLTENAGPVTWHGDYAAFLRKRCLEKNRAPAGSCSRTPPWDPDVPRKPRGRPATALPGSYEPDLIGLA
ncbi:unnamed protein product [Symbiodinium natans]|uniref:Uncharacterized protein n=1 Tax=Symbiodinium natans TaxID=878477 RepID=A0A812MUT5_9DINO|nr:unnamed protein product [Symbiodinium natans]